LYARWEQGNWRATEIDFTVDRDQWRNTFTEEERRAALWTYSMFFYGEDAVADNLSPYIDAAPREEQKYFLATQQVDEARHMQFYARFQDEVVADPAAIAAHVARARELLGPPFRKLFDEALVQAHARLTREPHDREAKVDFVTIYHMVIEGTLGITASHFLLDYLSEHDLLPGFVEGYGRIAADERRHIAYGTWFLREAVRDDPAMADVVRARLRELLPVVAESIAPPSENAWDVLGVEDGALATYALTALNRRLAIVGAPLE
jgi:ribonucleoside-diphosphate reductase beta chain